MGHLALCVPTLEGGTEEKEGQKDTHTHTHARRENAALRGIRGGARVN